MKNYKQKCIGIIISIIVFLHNSIMSNAQVLPLFAQSAIAMEATTGKVLYEKNAKGKIYPASTTKLWTAYLVIKNISDLNKIVTVEEDLSWVEPSSMYLKVGESFSVRQLLEVMMLKSANDVAVLLAIEVSGSVEEFSKLMNEEAKRLGCTNTNFVNPNGLPDDNHYSTAYDMALIARECVKNKILMEITSTEHIDLPSNEFYPYERSYTNSNKFISGDGQMPYNGELVEYKYDIVDGLKTGYTSLAGRCLLATAKIDDMRVITGVFNSKGEDVYTDSRVLIDYAFDNYSVKKIVDNEDIQSKLIQKIPWIKGGLLQGYLKQDYALVETKNVKTINMDKTYKENYTYKVKMPYTMNTMVEKDDVIGTVEIYDNNQKIESLNIYALYGVYPIFDLEQIILLTIGISLIIIIGTSKIKRKIKEKKRKSENIYLNKDKEENKDKKE